MPIPISKFSEKQKSLGEQLAEFLRSHPDEAYRVDELYAALRSPQGSGIAGLMLALLPPDQRERLLEPFDAALSALVSTGQVKAAEVDGLHYYAAGGF